MGMSLANRLRRLEMVAGSTGPCPVCPDSLRPVHLRDDAPEPPSCPVCGRRPFVVRLVRDEDFYNNRQRLEEVQRGLL
jgi:hypothetical protein